MTDDAPVDAEDARRRKRIAATQPGQVGMARLDSAAICGFCENFSLTKKGRLGNVGKCRLAVSRYGEDVPRIDRTARACGLLVLRSDLPVLTPSDDGVAADRALRDLFMAVLSGSTTANAESTVVAES